MSEAKDLADFKRALAGLVSAAEKFMKPGAEDPYIPAPDGTIMVQEATTRDKFLDDVLVALGWDRCIGGDLGEEVRLKGATTVFVDYLGVARLLEKGQETPTPLLLVEAKAWGKPIIGPRSSRSQLSREDLLIDGVEHIRTGGEEKKSPLRKDWHEHLVQVSKYVEHLAALGHKLQRVVLTSGDWLLILDDAHEAFRGGGLGGDQFTFLRIGEYVRRSDQLYQMLSKAKLGREMPASASVDRAPNYMSADQISSAFLATQVTHVQHGSALVGQNPVLSLVPHVILVDTQGRQLPVFANQPQNFELTNRMLGGHLSEVQTMAERVMDACSEVYSLDLKPSSLPAYPGLPRDWRTPPPKNGEVAPVQSEHAEWTVVTGDVGHFLLDQPLVVDCAFHNWAAARNAGHPAGNGSVSMPSVKEPRTLFVDGDLHHCAHSGMLAMREDRCRIDSFEERLCCQACRFLDACWPAQERAAMPCGTVLNTPAPMTEADDF